MDVQRGMGPSDAGSSSEQRKTPGDGEGERWGEGSGGEFLGLQKKGYQQDFQHEISATGFSSSRNTQGDLCPCLDIAL